ncbi:MAG TPA: hypothetical protein VMD30_03005 [Tepidisphaeraceae bacterium]|nr:hypothetical protein [Tepidisphaeraceae bacterium]
MSVLNNAVAFAQFRSRGGWKMMWILCGGFALLVAGIMFLTVEMDPHDLTETMEGWTVALGVIEALLLSIFGSMRVSGAVRQDLTGRMIESNRMTPISSAEAITGYLIGAPGQAIALAATSVLLGCVTSAWSGGSVAVAQWLQTSGFIALVVASMWIMTAFGAFLMRGAPFLLMIPIAIIIMSQGELLRILPGLALLFMPLDHLDRYGSLGLRFVDLAAIGSLVAMGVIFFFGAAR